MHIVAIDNIMHTIIFITIGAGAVLPIYLQFIFETYPLKILGLKNPTVHYKK
jgi:hypothetical protein